MMLPFPTGRWQTVVATEAIIRQRGEPLPSTNSRLRVLVLRDWRPGHYNQAEGLAQVVETLRPASVRRIDVRQRRLATNHLRRLALGLGRSRPAFLLRLLYDIDVAAFDPPPDLVIGAGRPTAAAGILLRRWCGARFLYSGFLRDYDADEIDLMIVRTGAQARAANQTVTPVPSIIDPDAWPPPRRPASAAELRGLRVSLLLGGKGPGYRYTAEEWRRLAELAAATAADPGFAWRVAGSRRTPPVAADLFAGLASRGVLEFVDFRTAGPGSANDLFGADVIAVTEDSITMMAEAMAARRPVVALRPAAVGPRAPKEEIAAMAEAGGMAVLPIPDATPERFVDTLLGLEPAGQDPRERIAAALAPLLQQIEAGRPADATPR